MNLTRARAGFCTEIQALLAVRTDWGMKLKSRAVERDLGDLAGGKLDLSQQCPGAQRANHVLGHQAQHYHGGDCPALLWGSLTFSAGGSFGNHNI